MDLAATALPWWVAGAGWMLALPVLAVAVVLAPWRRLHDDLDAHVWCGGVLCLVALWHAQPTGLTDLHVHLLGVAAYVLLVGPSLALAGCAVAVAAGFAMAPAAWLNAGLVYAVLALVPVGVTVIVREALRPCLRTPEFVRVLVTAWAGGALSFAASDVLRQAVTMPVANDVFAPAPADVWTALACLASAEAMLTGIVLTLFFVSGRGLAHDPRR